MLRNIRLRHSSLNVYFWSGCPRSNTWHQSVLIYQDSRVLHKRQYSFQSTVESVAKTQASIFKTLSESTPVEYVQNFLLALHDTTGLPWWATIVCATVLVRTTITLPLAVYQNYILAKLENLKLEMPAIVQELRKETAIAVKMYNWDEKMARTTYNRSLRKQWNNLIVRDNCHPAKASLLLWFQIPLWISLSIALRNLVYMLPHSNFNAKLTFTELSVGGFGFIPNLTVVDSSLILPVSLGLINLAIIELQGLSKERTPSKLQKRISTFFKGFSIIMVPIAATVPSCLALYWTTSSFYGLIQNIVLLSPRFRRICRIPKTSSELEKPYTHISNKLNDKIGGLIKIKQ